MSVGSAITLPHRGDHARAARLFLAFALALIACVIPQPRPTVAKAPDQYYSPETRQVLGQPFLTAWANGGNFAVFGDPVTAPIHSGKLTIQYFEFGALSFRTGDEHEANPAVTRVAVGTELLKSRLLSVGPAGRRTGAMPEYQGDGPTLDEASIAPLTRFYDQNGGKSRFGSPLGPPVRAAGEIRQWYEYGRLDIAANGLVQLAPSGLELAIRRGIHFAPAERADLPLLNRKRFHPFTGDGTIPEETGAFSPVRIMIPAIQIDAKIEETAIVKGVMGTPVDAWNVGWYYQLSSPGDWTNVVMAGHLDWWGIGPTVFYHLDQLQRGDRIYLVDGDGKGATYQVVRNYAVDADADPNPIVNDAGIEMLTLITCGGNFDGSEYLSRQIVRAKRV